MDLRKAAEMALEALEALWDILDDIDTASDMAKENDAWYRKRVEALQKKRWDTMITTDGYKLKGGPVEALRQALAHEALDEMVAENQGFGLYDDGPAVKTYAGGKPNYCTPVDAVPGFTVTEPRQSLSRMKPGDRFVLVRTGEIYRIENDGSQWNETRQRLARLHKNSQVRLIVDAVNMKQDPKTPLKVLNLTVFTENRLRNGRVYDVETLQAMTNRDILAIPDMGKKALKEVMEALNVYAVNMSQERVEETAKREHEPVAWMWKDGSLTSDPDEADGTWTKLYIAPPKREWVGLTDEDIAELRRNGAHSVSDKDFMAIEAKLKEKNT